MHAAAVACSVGLVRALVGRGALINQRDHSEEGVTPATLAIQAGRRDIVELFYSCQPPCTRSTDALNWTLLHHAAMLGDVDATRLCLTAGEEVGAVTNRGSTALHIAAAEGHIDVCNVLLEAGANLEATDTRGNTVLHKATFGGSHDTVTVLLERGANINAENDHGWFARYYRANDSRRAERPRMFGFLCRFNHAVVLSHLGLSKAGGCQYASYLA